MRMGYVGIGVLATGAALLGYGCATSPRVIPGQPDYADQSCPMRSPAFESSERKAIVCHKAMPVTTETMEIGAKFPDELGALSGYVSVISCHSGEAYLEQYPMSAKVEKNEDGECVVAITHDDTAGTTKKHAHRGDAMAFRFTVDGKKTAADRFPASAQVSVDLDDGRARIVEETLSCDILSDFVRKLGCTIAK